MLALGTKTQRAEPGLGRVLLPNVGGDFLESIDIFFYLSRLIYIVAAFLFEEHTCTSLFCSEQV
jgi:hypothetical protein